MTTALSLTGGRVLTAEGEIESADIHVAEGRIVEEPAAGARSVDCNGYHLLPGIVDVHGDAFELELHPRPGVDIALPIALGSIDRQLLANGITTAFHGLTISWEPGARSLDAGRRFMAGLEAARPALMADHRVQLRWETFAHDAIDDLAQWLSQDPTPSLAFNDHTTLSLETIRAGNQAKLELWARRSGVTLEAYVDEAEAVGGRAPAVPGKVREVAELARDRGAVLLSHDERSRDERAAFRALGAAVCEFPLAAEAAEDAASCGEWVVMGAPNVVRGGSHNGALSAEAAIDEGLCSVLASDYHYPSPLHAAERLVDRGVRPLGEVWSLVSRNPAAAMGLDDRGILEPGRRADIVAIDCAGPWRHVHTVAGGKLISFGR